MTDLNTLQQAKKHFMNGDFPEAFDKFEALINELKLTSFVLPRVSFYFSHLRILLRFTQKEKIEFNNFLDQLIVIKNHFKKVCGNAKKEDLYNINYNIALIKFILSQQLDAETLLRELIDSIEKSGNQNAFSEVFRKAIYLILEVYLVSKELDRFKMYISKLESIRIKKGKKVKEEESKNDISPFFWLIFYKLEGALIDNKLKEAEELLNVAENTLPGIADGTPDSSVQIMLASKKSQFLCKKGEYKNAISVLETLSVENKCLSPKLKLINELNKLCIAHKTGRKYRCIFEFSNLSKEIKKVSRQNFFGNSLCATDFVPTICLNYGIALLKTDPLQSFNLFCEASNLYYNTPLLWVKMGQACLQIYRHKLKEEKALGNMDFDEPNFKICTECYFIINVNKLFKPSEQQQSEKEKRKYGCKNCSLILESLQQTPFEILKNCYGISLSDSLTYFQRAGILLSKTSSPKTNYLKEIVYINRIAVYYYQKNYQNAIKEAKSFLSSSKGYKRRNLLLARIYCGEALCKIRNTREAMLVLGGAENVGADCKERSMKFVYNSLACAHILNEDGKNAKEFVNKSLELDENFLPAIRNGIALEELSGDKW